MIERHIPRHRQALEPCTCGRTPHLFQARGTTATTQQQASTTYFVECAPCFVRTGKFPSIAAAGHAWNVHHVSSFLQGDHAPPTASTPVTRADRTVTALRR